MSGSAPTPQWRPSGTLSTVDLASGDVDWQGDLRNTVFARPLVAGDTVSVGGADFVLRTFDRESGQQRWQDALDAAVTHGPFALGDRLVTLAGGGHLVRGPAGPQRFGPATLYVHRRDRRRDCLAAEGVARNGRLDRTGSLLVHVGPDTVRGHDADDGTVRFDRPAAGHALPVASPEICALSVGGASAGRLVALDAVDGSVTWEGADGEVPAAFTAGGDRLVTISDSTVVMRAAASGDTQWRRELDDSLDRPVWTGPDVYVSTDRSDSDSRLVALDGADGTVRWQRTAGYRIEDVETTRNAVFAASEVDDPDGGILVRVDRFDLDGSRQWQVTTDVSIGGTLAAFGRVGNVVYVASDTEVEALDPKDGERRWRYEPDNGGQVAVTTAAGTLFAVVGSVGTITRLPTD